LTKNLKIKKLLGIIKEKKGVIENMKIKETFVSTDNEIKCILSVDGYNYIGIAKCCPEDKDMQSEKTGQHIAYQRAFIKCLKHNLFIIKLQKKEIKDFYNSVKDGKEFNINGFVERKLRREIYELNQEIIYFKALIEGNEKSLKDFISQKDNFYQKIRTKRDNH